MFEYQPTKLHSKLLVMDDVVQIGSSNFDIRSLYLNLELMLRVDDAGFAGLMRDYFEGELDGLPADHRRAPRKARDACEPGQMGAVLLPRDQRRLYRDAPAQFRRRMS